MFINFIWGDSTLKNKEIRIEFENKINSLRISMISTAKLKGLSHLDTIKCSQELDFILNQYDKMKQLKRT